MSLITILESLNRPSTTLPLCIFQGKQLLCGVDCYGMLVSLAFRLAVLAVGTWALHCGRPARAALPRLRLFRCVVAALALVFLVSFWLFYAR